MLGACATVVLLCAGSTVTLDVDNKLSRRTVYGGTVHDPLELSVETISVGGTISPVVVRSQTAKSTYWQGRSQAGGGGGAGSGHASQGQDDGSFMYTEINVNLMFLRVGFL